jgi:hypothetical protein
MNDEPTWFSRTFRTAVAALALSCTGSELAVPANHPGNPSAETSALPMLGALSSNDHGSGAARAPGASAPAADVEESPDAARATTYTCPMHPEIVRDAPGSCPLCNMKLVPKETKK